MNTYQVLSIIGVPSLISTIIGFLFGYIMKLKKSDDAVKAGIRGLLKCQLLEIYNDCLELGFADYDTKQLFESLYTQYHALGGNGTMTGYYARILELPDGKGGENT